MIISAIRMRNVRTFGEAGIAIENIPERLSILAKSNEFGKSTVLTALKAVLFEKHSSSRMIIKSLIHKNGVAPVVEIEFLKNRKPYKLTTQFMYEPSTTLCSCSSNRTKHNEEAYNWIVDNVHKTEFATRISDLLWLEQGSSMIQPITEKRENPSFIEFLYNEFHQVTESEMYKNIVHKVRQELSQYTTKTGLIKKNDLQVSEKEEEKTRENITVARSRLNHKTTLRRKLDSISQSLKSREARLKTINTELSESRSTLESQESSRMNFDNMKNLLRAKQDIESRDNNILITLERLLAATERLEKEVSSALKGDKLSSERVEIYRKDLDLARESEATIRENRNNSEKKLKFWVFARHDIALKIKSDILWKKITSASSISNGIVLLSQKLNENPITSDVIQEFRSTFQEIDKLRTVLSFVRLSEGYNNTSPPLSDVSKYSIDPTNFKTIAKETGASSSIPDNTEKEYTLKLNDYIQHRNSVDTKLAKLFEKYEMRTEEEVERKASSRVTLENKIEKLLALYYSIAPSGIQALREEYDAELVRYLDNRLSDQDTDEVPDSTFLQSRVDYWTVRHDESTKRLQNAEDTYRREKLDADEKVRRSEYLKSLLKDWNSRFGGKDELQRKILLTRSSIKDNKRAIASLLYKIRESDVKLSSLGTVVNNVETLIDEKKHIVDDIQLLRINEAKISRELEILSEEDLERTVLAETTRLSDIQRKIDIYRIRVPALKLLEAKLVSERKKNLEKYMEPFVREIAPLLEFVFPNEKISFKQNFSINELERFGQANKINTLSGGTCEQISVLTRLAFAKLLSKRGLAIPVILDDALVWCDDKRIEDVFRALKFASGDVQCIVLTSHEKAFSTFGVQVLDVKEWLPSSDHQR